MNEIEMKALQVLENNKVAVFIVAYNAEKHIEAILNRIPQFVAEKLVEIYIIDDHSSDNTSKQAQAIKWPESKAPLKIYRTPDNQGYGGNQKLGYSYAVNKGFDIVVLLHGDGQYAPESLPDIIAAYADGYSAVFGSRFLLKGGAIKGGMPYYKWLGNRVLTKTQNILLKSNLSEMHSGYRSYRVDCLAQLPVNCNANNFHFDADIIIQFHDANFKIKEVPIPTYYGDEICHVNGMLYAWNCVKSFVKYRLMQKEIFYEPKFDIKVNKPHPYTRKESATSLHYYMRNLDIHKDQNIIDIGGGDGAAVSSAYVNTHEVTCIDQYADKDTNTSKQVQADLDGDWGLENASYDVAFALDVLEHLKTPEDGVNKTAALLKPGSHLYASTGNVAFIIIRLMLLMGAFNYGRRGILDLTHKRLFTKKSFRRLLENQGFRVEKIIGFGVPLEDLSKGSKLMTLLDRLSSVLAKIWPSMFAFQFLAVCTKLDDFESVSKKTFN